MDLKEKLLFSDRIPITTLHQDEITMLVTRLITADALAEVVPHLLAALDSSKEPLLYNQQEAKELVRKALRQYRETK